MGTVVFEPDKSVVALAGLLGKDTADIGSAVFQKARHHLAVQVDLLSGQKLIIAPPPEAPVVALAEISLLALRNGTAAARTLASSSRPDGKEFRNLHDLVILHQIIHHGGDVTNEIVSRGLAVLICFRRFSIRR